MHTCARTRTQRPWEHTTHAEFLLTTHCTGGAAKTSCLSFLYLSMLLLVCLRLSWCLWSPLSSPDTPPCPPHSTAVQVQLCRRWGESRRRTHARFDGTVRQLCPAAAAHTLTHTPVNAHKQTAPSRGGAGSLLEVPAAERGLNGLLSGVMSFRSPDVRGRKRNVHLPHS